MILTILDNFDFFPILIIIWILKNRQRRWWLSMDRRTTRKFECKNHLWMLTWYINLIITQLLKYSKMNGFTTLLYILVLAGLSEHSLKQVYWYWYISLHLTVINHLSDGEKIFALAEFKSASSSIRFLWLFNTWALIKSYSDTHVSVPGVWENIFWGIPSSSFKLYYYRLWSREMWEMNVSTFPFDRESNSCSHSSKFDHPSSHFTSYPAYELMTDSNNSRFVNVVTAPILVE